MNGLVFPLCWLSMPNLSSHHDVPYSAAAMYAIVADVENYPDTLRYIRSVEILARSEGMMAARVRVGLGLLNFAYECDIMLTPGRRIDIHATKGPFEHLQAHWLFTPLPDGGCRIDYKLDSRFRSALLERTAGLMLGQQLDQSIAAFEARLRSA